MNERFAARVAVRLFLEKDGKVLLMLRKNTGWMDGRWGIVAGHIDGGEPARYEMIREAKEEAGLDIRAEDLRLVHVTHAQGKEGHDDVEYVYLFFTAETWEGEPINAEPDKCERMDWFPLDALPKPMIPQIRDAIEKIREGRLYTEFGWKPGENDD